MSHSVSNEFIEKRIFIIRGLRIMIDRDLAELYQVPPSALNQAVKRNRSRFPDGFMFRISRREMVELITICDRFATLKHSSVTPLAFTEYGVAMLSSVLRSKRAVQINIQIVHTFIRLRHLTLTHKDFARKIEELERTSNFHGHQIKEILDAINQLIVRTEKSSPKIGFQP